MPVFRPGFSAVCCLALALLVCLAPCGCGRSSSVDESTGGDSQTGSDDENSEAETATGDNSPKTARKPRRRTKKPKGPQIGDIPLDAFGDEPVLAAATTVAPATTPTPAPASDPKPTDSQPDPAPADPKPAAGGDAWPAIITAETITEETKKIRLHLKDSLSSVSKYNGSYKDVQVDGAVIAAFAGIMPELPDPVTWKPKAKFVRDVAANMAKAAKGLAQANYDPTNVEYEKLESLLAGNSPAGVEEAAEKIPFSEVANRLALMRRMERAFQWISSNIKNVEGLRKEKDAVVHESTVLTALTKVVGTEGYDSADEEEYKGFVQAMLKASQDMTAAAEAEDFMALSDAVNRVKKTCDDCHKDYRFGN